jgi:WS/DGAT/MGAT family acyltransferase
MNHLSTVDAAFLHLETPETPMHVASLSLFELPKGYKGDYYEDVKALIAKRMHLASIFRRKLAQMPFELADPVWIEADDVDLDYHVRSITLRKPGTMEQLESYVARLHASLLDRSRPLWEAYVIEGLENGQVAYYWKAHHSGIDGKAGVELAKVFYDTSAEMREVPPPRRTRGPAPYQLGVTELLRAAVSNATAQYAKLGKMLPKAAEALRTVGEVMATRQSKQGDRSLNLGLAPKSIFNVAITNQRSYATLVTSLTDLKEIGRRAGGTVNTVVMAMCASALRKFMIERNLLPEKSMIALVPVSLRSADDNSMNNQVSAIRVDLATDIADPGQRFRAIHASSEDAKSVVSALKPVLGADVPLSGSPWIISSLASLYGRSGLAERLPPSGNVLISNVPGLPMELYMAGARMLSYYPVSIPYHGQALNITVQSYAGKMYWALTACRRALPQAEAYELIANLKLALKEIEKIATLHEAQPAAAAAPKPAEAPVKKVAAPRKRVAAKAPGKKVAAKAPRKAKTSAAATAGVKTPAPAAKARRASAGARAAR